MPCVSTPRRSASTRAEAMMAAFGGETPLAVRRFWVNAVAEVEETRWVLVSDGVAMVELRGKSGMERLLLLIRVCEEAGRD